MMGYIGRKPTIKDNWIAILIVGTILVALPLGIVLAVWLDNPTWLTLSLIAFILIYAG